MKDVKVDGCDLSACDISMERWVAKYGDPHAVDMIPLLAPMAKHDVFPVIFCTALMACLRCSFVVASRVQRCVEYGEGGIVPCPASALYTAAYCATASPADSLFASRAAAPLPTLLPALCQPRCQTRCQRRC